MMAKKRIVLNKEDYNKLSMLIDKLKTTGRCKEMYMKVLQKEMENAKIGEIHDPDFKNVTLNSIVTYKNKKNGEILKASIVFPAFADSAEHLYSILSPLGAALIGEKVGNTTVCYAPSGELPLEILEIEHPFSGK